MLRPDVPVLMQRDCIEPILYHKRASFAVLKIEESLSTLIIVIRLCPLFHRVLSFFVALFLRLYRYILLF